LALFPSAIKKKRAAAPLKRTGKSLLQGGGGAIILLLLTSFQAGRGNALWRFGERGGKCDIAIFWGIIYFSFGDEAKGEVAKLMGKGGKGDFSTLNLM